MSSPCNFDNYRVCKTPNSCTPREGDEKIKEELCPDPKTESVDASASEVEKTMSPEEAAEGAQFIVNSASTLYSAIVGGLGSLLKG